MDNYWVEKIPVSRLVEFAQAAIADKESFPFMPISPERALAQANNPAASPDDIGLFVAYRNDKCIGYRGFLPCWAKVGEEIFKIQAVSTFYVLPEYRRKRVFENQTVATYIHTEFFRLGYDGLATGSSIYAIRFYSRDERFIAIPALPYIRIRTGWISPFSSLFKKLSRVKLLYPIRQLLIYLSIFCSKTIDGIIYFFLESHLIPKSCRTDFEIKTIPVEKISKLNSDEKMSPTHKGIRSYRDEAIINWMIQFPWVLNDHKYKPSYYFSAPREKFAFLPYHLVRKDSNEYIGYAVYSISTEEGYTTLKILDYKTCEKTYEPYVLKLALEISKKENANVIEGSFNFWKYIGDRYLGRLITGQHQRTYFVWGKNGGIFEKHGFNFEADYNDGDKPFT